MQSTCAKCVLFGNGSDTKVFTRFEPCPNFSDLDCDVWEDFRKGELPEEEIDKQAKRQWKAALKSGRLSTDRFKANFADDWILIEVEDNGVGVFEHKENGDHLPRNKKEAERYVVGPTGS